MPADPNRNNFNIQLVIIKKKETGNESEKSFRN